MGISTYLTLNFEFGFLNPNKLVSSLQAKRNGATKSSCPILLAHKFIIEIIIRFRIVFVFFEAVDFLGAFKQPL